MTTRSLAPNVHEILSKVMEWHSNQPNPAETAAREIIGAICAGCAFFAIMGDDTALEAYETAVLQTLSDAMANIPTATFVTDLQEQVRELQAAENRGTLQ